MRSKNEATLVAELPKLNFGLRVKKDIRRNYMVYFMAIPMLAYYILFHYVPIYGATIAFRDYRPALGVSGSPWVGLENFREFFTSIYFGRLLLNTFSINVKLLIFGFPIPIIFALLLNEINRSSFKRIVQTVSYLPHFVSVMVICGMLIDFVGRKGIVNDIIAAFGGTASNLLLDASKFQGIYVASDIWQTMGWNSIIYIAAIAGVNQQLYEASALDGAGRFRKMWNVTLPSILPTIVIMLILRIGQMMNVGYEKIILLYNSNTYETADVISSYVFRKGLMDFDYSYSTAVGLFNSAINFILLITANAISKRANETSLW